MMFKYIRKYKHKKGFTIIELLVVIAVIAVLVLLAAPRLIGQTEQAKLAQIQNDIRVAETKVAEWLVTEDKRIADWDFDDEVDADGTIVDKQLKEGLGVGGQLENISGVIKDEINTNLTGEFYLEKEGKVYYWSSDDLKISVPEDENEAEKGSEIDRINGLEFDEWVEYLETNTEYRLATDDDFVLNSRDYLTYIGSDDYIIIPEIIHDKPVGSYYRMFNGSGTIYKESSNTVKGVASNNPNVTNVESMFAYSDATSLDVTYFNTENITNMKGMFEKAESLKELTGIENFDTSNVTNMYSMFSTTKTLKKLNLDNFNTENVTTMSWMFAATGVEVLDLSSFDTSNVTNMSAMFVNGPNIKDLDLSSFDTSKVTTMNGMFQLGKLDTLDLTSFDFSNVKNIDSILTTANTVYVNSQDAADTLIRSKNRSRNSVVLIKREDEITEPVTSQSSTEFYEWAASLPSEYTIATDSDFVLNSRDYLTYIGSDDYIIIPEIIHDKPVDSYYRMFNGSGTIYMESSNTVKGVASNNPNVTSVEAMFAYSVATSLDVTYVNTENITNMKEMFNEAKSLNELTGIENFDTSNVTNMYGMFKATRTLKKLNLDNFNTENVTTMSWMFAATGVEVLDLSSFNMSNVTNMSNMFVNSPKTTTGYARTPEEAIRLNNRDVTSIPSTLKFTVK